MRSPTVALIWQIWSRNRPAIFVAIGITILSGSFTWAYEDILRGAQANRFTTGFPFFLEVGNQLLLFFWVLVVLSIFNYTEFNERTGSREFPNRLFVLPVTSLQLVAVPMITGAAAVALTSVVWKWIFGSPWSFSLALAAYLVSYQGISWTLTRLGSFRMIILGVLGFSFFAISIVLPLRGLSQGYANALFAGFAVVSFALAGMWVAHQRSGGGFSRQWVSRSVEWISDRLPRRTRPFRSASRAQFWYEWRRSGCFLPMLVAGLLMLIAPFAWHSRNESAACFWIVVSAMAMPILLALPFGKGFSRPDLWSGEVTLPAFMAVRPLATHKIVEIKMKVAAMSTSLSWLLVAVFLSTWIPFANLEGLTAVRGALAESNGMLRAILIVVAAVFLTWRFLVAGLWIGLSGSMKLFIASALPYALSPVWLVPLVVSLESKGRLRVWMRNDPDGFVSTLVWTAAAALIAKFAVTLFSWRKMPLHRIRDYSVLWVVGTAPLVTLAIVLPFDRLRPLLILIALLYMPLARVGLAVMSLARNRHA